MHANVGGVVPLSTVDWHGKSSVVVFLNGCPFRCGYCHNSHLLNRSDQTDLALVKKRIQESKPFVSALVFLGGEPLMQGRAVEELAAFAKENGLSVGIHTNGNYSEAVSSLIDQKLADKFFIDIKAPLDAKSYARVAGVSASGISEAVEKTVRLVDESPLELELKTTVFPELVGTKEQIVSIAQWINDTIRQKQKTVYVLQQGKGENANDPVFQKMTFLSPAEMDELADAALENLTGIAVLTQTDENGRVVKTPSAEF